jgi:hypothetical protein
VSTDLTQLHLERLIQLYDQLLNLYTVYSQVISDLFTSILTVATIGKMQQSCQLTVFACGLSSVCRDIILLLLSDNCQLLKAFYKPLYGISVDAFVAKYEDLLKETLQIIFNCLPYSEDVVVEFRQAISQNILYPSLKLLMSETIVGISPIIEVAFQSPLKMDKDSSKSVLEETKTFLLKYERLVHLQLTVPHEIHKPEEILSKLLYKAIKELPKEDIRVIGKWYAAIVLAVMMNFTFEESNDILERLKILFQVYIYYYLVMSVLNSSLFTCYRYLLL